MRANPLVPGLGHTIFVCLCLMLASCDGTERDQTRQIADASRSNRPIVITSHYPLYFFATKIVSGIDTAPDIVLPEIEGDPASWIPGTAQIQLLQSADMIIVNGAGAEPWLDWVSLDESRIVDTSADISDRLIALDESVLHRHGPKGDHSNHATAFTTWLDPLLAIEQAKAVERALAALTPEHAAKYRHNMAVLEQELMELDGKLSDVFAQLQDRPVFFSHPVYQYLQRRYGINGQSLHWEPGEEPTTPGWINLQQRRTSHPATIMIWEDEPLPTTVRRVERAGISSVAFHTAADRPTQGDLITVMLANAQRLQELTTRKKQLPIPRE
jgi:zinc transport system substrate-binding protein